MSASSGTRISATVSSRSPTSGIPATTRPASGWRRTGSCTSPAASARPATTGPATRWRTVLELTDDAWATAPTSFILHRAPASAPARKFLPYLGDYIRLVAVGTEFFGVFAGSNLPDLTNFPHGVSYQRNANFATKTLLRNDGVTPVPPSIDPFFVHYAP